MRARLGGPPLMWAPGDPGAGVALSRMRLGGPPAWPLMLMRARFGATPLTRPRLGPWLKRARLGTPLNRDRLGAPLALFRLGAPLMRLRFGAAPLMRDRGPLPRDALRRCRHGLAHAQAHQAGRGAGPRHGGARQDVGLVRAQHEGFELLEVDDTVLVGVRHGHQRLSLPQVDAQVVQHPLQLICWAVTIQIPLG